MLFFKKRCSALEQFDSYFWPTYVVSVKEKLENFEEYGQTLLDVERDKERF